MALDNESSTGPNDFSDGAPASDVDPYSSSSGSKAVLINVNELPKPIPIFGPLFGYNYQFLSKVANERIEAAAKVLQRAPSDDESTAMTYWTAKQMSITSYGAPVGVAGGAYQTYSTAATFRFPFYKPDVERLKPFTFPSTSFAALTGSRAVMAWHAVRLVAYGTVGKFLGQMFFSSYAMSVVTVGELSDPRLKDWVDAVKKMSNFRRGGLPNEARGTRPVGGGQEKEAAGVWTDRSREIGDDASHTSARYGDTETNDVYFTTEDGPSTKQTGQEAWTRSGRPATPRDRKAGLSNTSQQGQDLDDDFDDASPTGGRGMEDTEDNNGSAWGRIRQQATSKTAGKTGSSWPSEQGQEPSRPSQSAPRKTQNISKQEMRGGPRHGQDGSSTGESFSFSKSEEDRQLAREEAQREFNARVEQERRGGDFGSADGEDKRW